MTTISCQAVFENGVLRPLSPPALQEGEAVEVIIITQQPAAPGRTPAGIIAAIAALPVEASAMGCGPFSSSDCIDVVVDVPGDSTVRPLRPSLMQAALAERERLARWQQQQSDQPPQPPESTTG
jgi:Protein of unknown function DUF104